MLQRGKDPQHTAAMAREILDADIQNADVTEHNKAALPPWIIWLISAVIKVYMKLTLHSNSPENKPSIFRREMCDWQKPGTTVLCWISPALVFQPKKDQKGEL